MPDPITFRVYGEPKAQPRPRAFMSKNGGRPRVWTPETAEGWKGDIAIAARDLVPTSPLSGPLRLDVEFLFVRPQRLYRKKDSRDRIPHTAKPDRDNAEKAVADALKTLGFFVDDAQICAGEIRKWWVAIGETPGAIVTITPLEADAEARQTA